MAARSSGPPGAGVSEPLDQRLIPKQSLEYVIMRFGHPESAVRRPGAAVIIFHVEAQTANAGGARSFGLDEIKQRLENAATPELRVHVNTLQPPIVAVAPIAPFMGDEQLANNVAADNGNEVSPFGGVAQQGFDAGPDAGQFERQTL